MGERAPGGGSRGATRGGTSPPDEARGPGPRRSGLRARPGAPTPTQAAPPPPPPRAPPRRAPLRAAAARGARGGEEDLPGAGKPKRSSSSGKAEPGPPPGQVRSGIRHQPTAADRPRAEPGPDLRLMPPLPRWSSASIAVAPETPRVPAIGCRPVGWCQIPRIPPPPELPAATSRPEPQPPAPPRRLASRRCRGRLPATPLRRRRLTRRAAARAAAGGGRRRGQGQGQGQNQGRRQARSQAQGQGQGARRVPPAGRQAPADRAGRRPDPPASRQAQAEGQGPRQEEEGAPSQPDPVRTAI